MASDLLLGPSAVRDYARRHTLTAMRTVVELCQNGKKETTRLAAAKELLDRGWGRSVQSVLFDGSAEGSELLTILKDSYSAATTQINQPMMIERSVETDTQEIIDNPSRVKYRPKLKPDE